MSMLFDPDDVRDAFLDLLAQRRREREREELARPRGMFDKPLRRVFHAFLEDRDAELREARQRAYEDAKTRRERVENAFAEHVQSQLEALENSDLFASPNNRPGDDFDPQALQRALSAFIESETKTRKEIS